MVRAFLLRSGIPNFHRRSPLRHHLRRHISNAVPSHIQLSSCFSHISLKSIATSPQFSTGNEVLETPAVLEALRNVPSLSLNDIPKKLIQIPIEVGDINGVKVLKHEIFTRCVLYCELAFDMSSLKQELLPLVPLFWLSDFQDFANAIDAIKDKGVVVAMTSPDDVDDANKERPNFFQVKKVLEI